MECRNSDTAEQEPVTWFYNTTMVTTNHSYSIYIINSWFQLKSINPELIIWITVVLLF